MVSGSGGGRLLFDSFESCRRLVLDSFEVCRCAGLVLETGGAVPGLLSSQASEGPPCTPGDGPPEKVPSLLRSLPNFPPVSFEGNLPGPEGLAATANTNGLPRVPADFDLDGLIWLPPQRGHSSAASFECRLLEVMPVQEASSFEGGRLGEAPSQPVGMPMEAAVALTLVPLCRFGRFG